MGQRVGGENQRPPPLHPHHGAHGLGMSVPRETQGSFDEEVGPRVGASNHGGWFLHSMERFAAKQSAVRRCLPTGVIHLSAFVTACPFRFIDPTVPPVGSIRSLAWGLGWPRPELPYHLRSPRRVWSCTFFLDCGAGSGGVTVFP